VLAWVAAGCGFHHGHAAALPPDDADADAPPDVAIDAVPDAPPDAFVPCLTRWANGTIRFGAPQALDINSASAVDRDPFLSHDELTIFFSSERAATATDLADVFIANRTAIDQPFNTPTKYAAASTPGYDSKMAMTMNQLILVVASNQTGTKGLSDIWQATRSSTGNSFGALDESHEGAVDNTAYQLDPFITADGLHLYWAEDSPQVIEVASRGSTSSNFGSPAAVAGITDTASQADPTLSEDELVIIFSSGRTGSAMGGNLWYATRARTSDTFGTPQPVPDVNTDANEGDAHLSADGCRLYFASDAGASYDLYVASMR
jgi:hypothetical protein